METLWLLTRAWNTGVLLYSLAQYPEAERWCGLAMSFIRHLGSLQESYETKVQDGGEEGVGVAVEHYRGGIVLHVSRGAAVHLSGSIIGSLISDPKRKH